MNLFFENWGLIDYELALRKQETYVDLVYQKQKPPTIIFCKHPPVVTTGRATQKNDILDWAGPTFEINRGGRATYHGPNQIMIYPIIPLQEASNDRRPSDVASYLRQFELAIVDTLFEIGLTAQGKSYQSKVNENNIEGNGFNGPNEKARDSLKEETGVWIGNKKVASLGISVRQWITFHGAALNVNHDPNAFQGIKPCGFSPSVMTSIEELLGGAINQDQIIGYLMTHLNKRL